MEAKLRYTTNPLKRHIISQWHGVCIYYVAEQSPLGRIAVFGSVPVCIEPDEMEAKGYPMKKVKTAILAAAAAFGALSLGYAADANASAYALTQDAISRLTFSAARVSNGNLIGFGAFQFSASSNASLSTTGFESDGDAHVGSAFSLDRNLNVGPGGNNIVDPDHSFQSDGPDIGAMGQNNFNDAGTGSNNFSRSDHILSDTAVNKAGLVACGTGPTCGGDFRSVAETFVKATSPGSPVSGSAAVNNSQTWALAVNVPAAGANITIEFDLDLTQVVSLVNETVPGTATSNFNLSFQVGTNKASFVSLLNADSANPFATADETSIAGTGTSGVNISFSDANGVRHYVVTFRVPAGPASLLISYQAATSATSVQPDPVHEVPEPMTLGLVGLSLVGLGVLARRRQIAA